MDDTLKSGNSESWSGIDAFANTSEAAIVVGFLQSHDIPARVVDKSFHQTPTSGEDLTPIEVAVPTHLLEAAREALAKRDREFATTPEGSVLTDEGPVADPSAGGDGEG